MLIDKDAYLQEVSRYIVLNPVSARLCANAGDWEWSSYRAVMGKVPAEDWLAVADILAIFGSTPGPARRPYARFVEKGVGRGDPMDDVTAQLSGEDIRAIANTYLESQYESQVQRDRPEAYKIGRMSLRI